jgi:hypothetical protein
MDGTAEHHNKQSKPDGEGQRLHLFPHMYNTSIIHDCISGSVWGDYREAGEEKRMIVILKCNASVYEDSKCNAL